MAEERESRPVASGPAQSISTAIKNETSVRGRRRRVLEVELAGPGSLVRGHGSRELVIEVTGRPPTFIPRLRGWSLQEGHARDVIAAAEVRGYDVIITGPRLSTRSTPDAVQTSWKTGATVFQQPDPARGLW